VDTRIGRMHKSNNPNLIAINLIMSYIECMEILLKNKKRFFAGLALAFFAMSIASCTLTRKILPPGQAKKITGQQSASSLAPGKK
jgi:hypothetical protein